MEPDTSPTSKPAVVDISMVSEDGYKQWKLHKLVFLESFQVRMQESGF